MILLLQTSNTISVPNDGCENLACTWGNKSEIHDSKSTPLDARSAFNPSSYPNLIVALSFEGIDPGGTSTLAT